MERRFRDGEGHKVMEDKLKTEKDVDVYVSLIGSTQESTFQGNGKIKYCGSICEIKAA